VRQRGPETIDLGRQAELLVEPEVQTAADGVQPDVRRDARQTFE
jgi:hypothetical protein